VNASQRFANEPINYVDIGSRDGLLGFLKPFEKILNIIFFEPDHEEFNKLQNTHQSQRVQIFNTAVSDTNSKKILNLTRSRGCSSLLHPSGHMLGLLATEGDGVGRFSVEDKIEVATQRIDEIFEFPKINLDILKVDTQGSEFEILSSLGAHRPFLICSECSTTELYKNQKTLFSIGLLLEEMGYFPIHLMERHLLPKTATKWRGSIQVHGDAIFVPDNSANGRAIIERDVEKWFAALCMHGYMDFALWQIEELKIPKPALITQTEELLRKS
jgi:FkbM family methyltransferase